MAGRMNSYTRDRYALTASVCAICMHADSGGNTCTALPHTRLLCNHGTCCHASVHSTKKTSHQYTSTHLSVRLRQRCQWVFRRYKPDLHTSMGVGHADDRQQWCQKRTVGLCKWKSAVLRVAITRHKFDNQQVAILSLPHGDPPRQSRPPWPLVASHSHYTHQGVNQPSGLS